MEDAKRIKRGGRPNRRGDSKRAVRLRVAREDARWQSYDHKRTTAADLPGEVAATADYVRSALRGNATAVTDAVRNDIRDLLDELALRASAINAGAAKQANKDGNKPRSRRGAEKESA
jgi:hypothetical protein